MPSVITYNAAKIQGWENEKAQIPGQIAANQASMTSLKAEISPLKRELANYRSQIGNVDSRIAHRRRHLNQERAREQARHNSKDGWHLAGDLLDMFAGDPEMKALKREKAPLVKQKDRLKSKISQKEDRLTELTEANQALRRRDDLLTNTLIPNATNFLNSLHQTPAALCRSFEKRILDEMEGYEKTHAANQCVETRLFLYNIVEKVQAIMTSDEDELSVPEGMSAENRKYQLRLAKLCGFLWSSYTQVCNDAILSQRVFAILQDMHIENNSDLPDQAATGKSVAQQFNQLQEKPAHNSLFTMTTDELIVTEKRDYKAAYEKLDAATIAPASHRVLQSNSRDILGEINTEHRRAIKTNQPFDYKFSTRVLKKTHQVLTTPNNAPLLEEYAELSNQASGKSSCWKKVAGIMLGIVGLAMVAGSVIACLATFGVAAPLGAITASFGTTLLAEGLSMVAYTAAVSVTVGGFSLFSDGLHQGTSKRMHNLKKSADKINAEEQQRALSAPLLHAN